MFSNSSQKLWKQVFFTTFIYFTLLLGKKRLLIFYMSHAPYFHTLVKRLLFYVVIIHCCIELHYLNNVCYCILHQNCQDTAVLYITNTFTYLFISNSFICVRTNQRTACKINNSGQGPWNSLFLSYSNASFFTVCKLILYIRLAFTG